MFSKFTQIRRYENCSFSALFPCNCTIETFCALFTEKGTQAHKLMGWSQLYTTQLRDNNSSTCWPAACDKSRSRWEGHEGSRLLAGRSPQHGDSPCLVSRQTCAGSSGLLPCLQAEGQEEDRGKKEFNIDRSQKRRKRGERRGKEEWKEKNDGERGDEGDQ